MSQTLDIQILGKDYRVACGDDERASLERAVQVLQERLRLATHEKSRLTGERLAVMVALEIAHELVQAHAGERGRSPDAEPGATSGLASVDSENLRRSIASIEARIDAALEPNESLF